MKGNVSELASSYHRQELPLRGLQRSVTDRLTFIKTRRKVTPRYESAKLKMYSCSLDLSKITS